MDRRANGLGGYERAGRASQGVLRPVFDGSRPQPSASAVRTRTPRSWKPDEIMIRFAVKIAHPPRPLFGRHAMITTRSSLVSALLFTCVFLVCLRPVSSQAPPQSQP